MQGCGGLEPILDHIGFSLDSVAGLEHILYVDKQTLSLTEKGLNKYSFAVTHDFNIMD